MFCSGSECRVGLELETLPSSSYREETGSFQREEEKTSWSSGCHLILETQWDSVTTTMDTASLRMEDGEGCDEALL